MKISFIFIILMTGFSLAGVKERKLIQLVDKEIQEVSRLIKSSGSNTPGLELRKAESYLERARLYSTIESEKYLLLSPEYRRSQPKEKFFKSSRASLNQAKEICSGILRRFPSYPKKGYVYYILGFYEKEVGRQDNALRNFRLAQQNSQIDLKLNQKVNLALGDLYYEKSDFSRALVFYKKEINGQKDRWWTRDAYRLGICYQKLGRYNDSVNVLKSAHRYSSDERYLDLKKPIEKALMLSFLSAGRIDEATNFFKGDSASYSKLMTLANNLADQGEWKRSLMIYKMIERSASQEQRAEVYLNQMELFHKLGKDDEHYFASKKLMSHLNKNTITKKLYEDLRVALKKKAIFWQKKILQSNSIKPSLIEYTQAYFNHLIRFDSSNAATYHLLKAEMLLSKSYMKESFSDYNLAYDKARSRNDNKTAKDAIEGLLLVGERWKGIKDSQLKTIYTKYLSLYPNTTRSKIVYQKLFKTHLDSGDVKKAEKTFYDFSKNYKSSSKEQGAMAILLAGAYRAKKQYIPLNNLILNSANSRINIPSDVSNTLRSYLTGSGAAQAKDALLKGDKSEAVDQYTRLYKMSGVNRSAKIEAAYNLFLIHISRDDKENAYTWGKQALRVMKTADIEKYDQGYLALGNYFFEKQEFDKAYEIFQTSFYRLCRKRSPSKELFYRNAGIMMLAIKKAGGHLALYERGQTCQVPRKSREIAADSLLRSLESSRNWRDFQTILQKSERDNLKIADAPYYWGKLLELYNRQKDFNSVREIKRKLASFNSTNFNFSGRSRTQLVIPYFKGIDQEKSKILQRSLDVEESKIGQVVKENIGDLNKIVGLKRKIEEYGSVSHIVRAGRSLSQLYAILSDRFKTFNSSKISGASKSKWEAEIHSLAPPLSEKSKEILSQVSKISNQNMIFDISVFKKNYPTKFLLIDKGSK